MVTTEMMENHSTTGMTGENTSSSACACMFTPESGAMITNAWLLLVPTGMMHEFAVSIHAEGLEANGTYIVEGTLTSGSMNTVPISTQSMSMNSTSASEFQSDKNGTGNYWLLLDANPATTFENIQLFFLPGMSMQNATLVASVNLTSMMMNTTETMMTSSTS